MKRGDDHFIICTKAARPTCSVSADENFTERRPDRIVFSSNVALLGTVLDAGGLAVTEVLLHVDANAEIATRVFSGEAPHLGGYELRKGRMVARVRMPDDLFRTLGAFAAADAVPSFSMNVTHPARGGRGFVRSLYIGGDPEPEPIKEDWRTTSKLYADENRRG